MAKEKEKLPEKREEPAASSSPALKNARRGLSVYEIALFPMLGALMFATKFLMQALPNIHLLGLFLVSFTLVFRAKALWPLGVYLALDGIANAFSPTWLPYLYVWPLLWGAVMLLPKRMPRKAQYLVYPLVSGLHGLLFGTLYTPGWALATGMPVSAWGAWIVSGLGFDAIHGASNFCFGFFIPSLCDLMKRLLRQRGGNA